VNKCVHPWESLLTIDVWKIGIMDINVVSPVLEEIPRIYDGD
jgi:hypothetical protein